MTKVATQVRNKCDYCLQPAEKLNPPAHLRQTDGKWTTKLYSMCDGCKECMRGYFKYHREHLVRGTTKCPIDGSVLHFKQIHGMRIYRTITPEKPKHEFEVFDSFCPSCDGYFSVIR